jgi:hypothetical protein
MFLSSSRRVDAAQPVRCGASHQLNSDSPLNDSQPEVGSRGRLRSGAAAQLPGSARVRPLA